MYTYKYLRNRNSLRISNKYFDVACLWDGAGVPLPRYVDDGTLIVPNYGARRGAAPVWPGPTVYILFSLGPTGRDRFDIIPACLPTHPSLPNSRK